MNVTLIGEEIEGAWNVEALTDVARSFGGEYLSLAPRKANGGSEGENTKDRDALRDFDWLIAAENTPDAVPIYSYRLQPGRVRPALLMGNEAKGLRRGTRKQADVTVQIPIVSRNINCLNVAAAAAVMLAYLNLERPLPYPRRTLSAVQRERPDVLLIGGPDHRELGSAIRSATAFGWDTLLLEDRHAAWYACDRAIRSEGRGTARRGRNPIRVVPWAGETATEYRRIVIVTRAARCKSLFTLPLIGRDTFLVLPDEGAGTTDWKPPIGMRGEVVYASLPPISPEQYHFRQMASLALAETARQLGQPGSDGIYLRGRRDRYRREVEPNETEAEESEADPAASIC